MSSPVIVARVVTVAIGTLAALYALYLVRDVVGLVLGAVFVALALAGPVAVVEARGVPRAWAILLVYLASLAALVGIGLLLVPPVVSEVNELVKDAPGLVGDLEGSSAYRRLDTEYDVSDKLLTEAEKLPEHLGDLTSVLADITVGVFARVTQLVIVLVLAFLLLMSGGRILDFGFSRLDPALERRARRAAEGIGKAVAGYIAGSLLLALIAGVLSFFVMELLSIPFAIPLAVLFGFTTLIPLVGLTIGGVIVGIVAAFHGFPTALIVWGVFFLLYQQVNDRALGPYVYKRTVELHPLVAIVAVLIGGTQLGILGALVAIPAAATIQIFLKDLYEARRQGDEIVVPSSEGPTPSAPEPA